MSTDDLEARFVQAAEDVTQLPEAPDNHIMLELYGLFKQATHGDATGKRPSLLDLVARAKHDAWAGNKGMSPDKAKKKYVALVEELKQKVADS